MWESYGDGIPSPTDSHNIPLSLLFSLSAQICGHLRANSPSQSPFSPSSPSSTSSSPAGCSNAPPGSPPLVEVDAVYILAGTPSRSERIDAVLDWAAEYDCRPVTILIPEDLTAGLYPSRTGKQVSSAQWHTERLREPLPPRTARKQALGRVRNLYHSSFMNIVIVPGYYYGTDGEMQALAAFLDPNPTFRRVALVTSRSHIRRALKRAPFLHRGWRRT